MPYDSDAQRRFMHARHPGIASEWDQEIRSKKRRKDVSKRLASSMRAIKMGEEITNPHIATRVMAHDRGKVAGKLIASGRKQEAAVNAKYRKPIKARSPLTAPLSIAGDEINRFYAMQGVHGTQNAAKQVQRQGQWAREMSREQIGKSMRLSEVAKAVSPETRKENDRKAVARGVGTVAIGGGLVAGGIPGTKVNSDAISGVKRGPVKNRAKAAWESGRGGILGYRQTAHANYVDRQGKKVAELGSHWPTHNDPHGMNFHRGLERGKIKPEADVIRQLTRGRKAAGVALAGGVGLHVYGKKNKGEKVHKGVLARRTPEQRSENRRGKSTALAATGGAIAAGGIGGAKLLESQANKWNERARQNIAGAQKIAPAMGGSVPTNMASRTPGIRPVRSHIDILQNHHNEHSIENASPKKILEAGKKRGAAANEMYIRDVYAKHGKLFRKYGTGAGAAIAGVGGGALALRHRREQKEKLKKAAGPVMRGEIVGFGKNWSGDAVPFGKALGGSNIREYSHLPENIRADVAYGSIGPRRNPMSALDLFASSRIMAATRARGRIGGRRLTARAQREMGFAGSRAMLYSPTGRGSAFL